MKTNEMDKINYSHETKCRRCGNLTEWIFYDSTTPYLDFAEHMKKEIQNPINYFCHKCEKQTVQDIVFYQDGF